MSALLASLSATLIEGAWERLSRPTAWPDVESGFAHRLLSAAALPLPDAYVAPSRAPDAQTFRRSPELAAFGYVLGTPAFREEELHAGWGRAYARLMLREVFTADRNASFIYNPLELLGIALGAKACRDIDGEQRRWLAENVRRARDGRHLVGPIAELIGLCADHVLTGDETGTQATGRSLRFQDVGLYDLCVAAALSVAFPMATNGATGIEPWADPVGTEQEIVRRALTEAVHLRGIDDAAAVYVCLQRAVERASIHPGLEGDAIARIVALCRRFQLFVDRLQQRQRGRPPVEVVDEYDVQDLLHAILRLHFDDVRPEEWTPSYAGRSSRVDFYLPRERTVVEAKMTRANLGQKEVADELIIDKERYRNVPDVDALVCFVYDPGRRCTNPAALEADLAQIRPIRVAVVVCPRGT